MTAPDILKGKAGSGAGCGRTEPVLYGHIALEKGGRRCRRIRHRQQDDQHREDERKRCGEDLFRRRLRVVRCVVDGKDGDAEGRPPSETAEELEKEILNLVPMLLAGNAHLLDRNDGPAAPRVSARYTANCTGQLEIGCYWPITSAGLS